MLSKKAAIIASGLVVWSFTAGVASAETENRHATGIAIVGAERYQAVPSSEAAATAFDEAYRLAFANPSTMAYPWIDPAGAVLSRG